MDFALSIIIPAFNAEKTIGALLESVVNDADDTIEVIVVDDCSTDGTAEIVGRFPSVRIVRADSRRGAAAARNLGVRHATHDLLVFTDADTVFEEGTIPSIRHFLSSHPGALCAAGIYSRVPANKGFMPRYKALWECAMLELGDKGKEISQIVGFPVRPGIVHRSLFERVKGFDEESFSGADLEDMDFGNRVAKISTKYTVRYISIRHNYPERLLKELRTFARRSFLWPRTFLKHRMFEGLGEASLENVFANVAALLLPVGLVCALWRKWFLWFALACLTLFVVANWRFYRLAFKEEGVLFAVRSALTRYIHVVVLAASAGFSIVTLPFAKRKQEN